MAPPTGDHIVLFVVAIALLYGVLWLVDRRPSKATASAEAGPEGALETAMGSDEGARTAPLQG